MTRIHFEGGPRHGMSTSLDTRTAAAGRVLVVDQTTGRPLASYVPTDEVRTVDGVPHVVWRHDPSASQAPVDEATLEAQRRALDETVALGSGPDEDPASAAELLAAARAEIARRRDR